MQVSHLRKVLLVLVFVLFAMARDELGEKAVRKYELRKNAAEFAAAIWAGMPDFRAQVDHARDVGSDEEKPSD